MFFFFSIKSFTVGVSLAVFNVKKQGIYSGCICSTCKNSVMPLNYIKTTTNMSSVKQQQQQQQQQQSL